MLDIGILNFPLNRAPARLVYESLHALYEHFHPEGDANYIDRHNKHVDTNYVSSGGWERMK
jgi:hypothetical protein